MGNYPQDYTGLNAKEAVIEDARSIKEELGLTWTEFLRRATIEIDTNTEN